MPTCLSEITFGSFLAYSPRGASAVSIKSRTLTYEIKSDRGRTIPRLAARLAKEITTSEKSAPLGQLLGAEVTLVPCPRSYLLVKGGLWPGEQIAKSLVAAGLGKAVELWLERTRAVPKSSAAEPGKRPKIRDHLESMQVSAEPTIFVPPRIVVVDDVITKGATLIAAVSLLKEKFPTADIKAFALVRTLGMQREIDQILAPCIGTVMSLEGEAEREP